jgi:prepilin-type N-terminal cleavage/methylation domain-containing protein
MSSPRAGLTLIEVIVAMLLFSTGALALSAGSAAITRQMTVSLLRSRASAMARSRDEAAHATGCAGISSGSETREGIRATWTVSSGTTATLDQLLERRAISSQQTDRFLSAIPCD